MCVADRGITMHMKRMATVEVDAEPHSDPWWGRHF